MGMTENLMKMPLKEGVVLLCEQDPKRFFVEDKYGNLINFGTGKIFETNFFTVIAIVKLRYMVFHSGKTVINKMPIICSVKTGIPKDRAIRYLRNFVQRCRQDLAPEQIEVEEIQFHEISKVMKCLYGRIKIGRRGCYCFLSLL